MTDIFTTRETAIIIWTAIIFICAFFKKQLRASILGVIKSALKIKFLKYFFSYLFYISLFVYTFYYLKWWDISNLKDTVIWFIFSGIPIGFVVATKKLERGFWKNLVLDNLKLMVLVEFIINSYTFPLAVEFFFMLPFITMVTALNAFSKHNKEYKNVERLTNLTLALFGFTILFYSLYLTIVEINSIENMNTLQSILFPAIYSIISIPYMYIFKLIVEYENLFTRLKLGRERSRELNSLIKRQLILFCNFDIKKLQIAANMNNYNIMSISSKDEIDVMIKSYKNALLRGSDKSEITKSRPTWITLKTQQELTSANTNESETILKFSDSKKEELVGYMTEYYNAKEAEVLFIPPSNTSSNGLLLIDYYTDTTPTRTVLNNNIANVVILSESLAEESGIPTPNVSVRVMTMDGTPLGVGNYYSLTGKAFIDVSDCPEV